MNPETAVEGEVVDWGGPWFEELSVGDVFSAPALTLTHGHAALHQAIIGDRLRLALDAHLSERVLGSGRQLAHPLLVCDIAIGQSTLPTQRVIGNLFYRRLTLKRSPAIGDTLRTTTEIVALKRNSQKPGRAATGLAVLRVHTVDQEERDILDYWRCAMLPLKDADAAADRADDLDAFPAGLDSAGLAAGIEGWDLDYYRSAVAGPHFADLIAPTTWKLEGGESVTCAPELARLSLNIAMTHTDPTAGRNGKRLVYGGHTIGIAAAHVTRVLPNLLTILGWHHCNHTAPVMEGDVLHSTVTLESTEPLPGGGGIVNVHSEVTATRGDGSTDKVLDWRLAGALA